MSKSITLVNPTVEQVAAAIAEVVAHANTGARARTVSAIDAAQVFTADNGGLQRSGGGVANSYGYKATTSQIAVAWFVDVCGRRHVRVFGGRYSVSGRNVRSMFEQHYGIEVDVYPELVGCRMTKSEAKRLPKIGRALAEAVRENPADPVARSAFADWLEEQGRYEYARERCAAIKATELASVAIAV